jgi:tetratricopeptide (TPR) repeat protein
MPITELNKVSKGSAHYVKARFHIFKYRTEDFERLRSEGADTTKAYRYAVRAKNDYLEAIRVKGPARTASKRDETERMMNQGALLSARLFIYGPEAKYRQGLKDLSNFEQRYPHARELFLSVGIARVETYQKLREFNSAEAEVRKVMQSSDKHPQGKTILTTLAGRLVKNAETTGASAQNSYRIAILIYEHLLAKSRKTPLEETIQYALASLYLKVGDYGQAKTMYQEIIKNDPQSTEALSGLGKICEQEEEYEQALEYWRLLEEHLSVGEPAWYEAKYKLAFTHDILGNTKRACKILTVTRKLHPDLGGDAIKEKFLQLEKKVCSP